ncbi:helix-turn-helix domain-containing protein [Heyndrickxia ginsengihumi]|uniref:helix-turn-helix domain-containing protein n=1 Tax=Heyndrickxia ginsengihumi TaxID=363870 RepID=UPI00047182A3|nr:helix-turn-helix transcriptional regulator [Heyndrickxia ginsengihumi]
MLTLDEKTNFKFRGDRLKRLRINKKLTQEELGKIVNVTKVSISGYEKGKRSPDTETLNMLADYFNVTTDYLLGRTDDEKGHYINESTGEYKFTEKDERDIAKRMDQIRKDLMEANNTDKNDGLNFYGEPMSEEAVDSLLEAMEFIVRQTQVINKKYIPKKYRDKKEDK